MSSVSDKQVARPFENLFEAVRSSETNPQVLRIREAAFQRFCEIGIPSTKSEDWKYTNVQPLAKTRFQPAAAVSSAGGSALAPYAKDLPPADGPRLVFVDGIFRGELSQLDGVEISPLQPVLHDDQASPFPFLNAALATEGRTIRILKKTSDRAVIQVVHVASGTGASAGAEVDVHSALAIPARLSIIAEASSKAEIAEYYFGVGSETYFRSVYTEILCEEESDLEHTKIQCEGMGAFHIANLVVRQRPRSKFTSNVFSFGGGLVRNEIHPVLEGERIECFLNGLTVIAGDQHVDNSTVIDHAKPNCFSRELYKGIYAEAARGVFSGTIIVRPDAQKTNAIQSNQSVLLSGEASVETRPQLKIWADDVKCTHGATVGQLDEDARFYLRSRGIPAGQAQAMLLQAFAGDIVSHVASVAVRASLERLLAKALRTG